MSLRPDQPESAVALVRSNGRSFASRLLLAAALATISTTTALLTACGSTTPRHADQGLPPTASRSDRSQAEQALTGEAVVPQSGNTSEPFQRLRARAAAPAGTSRTILPPDPSLAPIDPEDPSAAKAFTTLDSLQPADLRTDVPPAEQEAEKPSDDDRSTAMRLYAEARLLTKDGNPNQAITILEQAAALDPASPAIWRALGDARRAARFEHSAGAAYQRAAETGTDEPQALLLAGLHARTNGDNANAAAWLLAATRATPAHADPLVTFVASAALGESLIELGYDTAAIAALEQGLRIPSVARVPTEVGREAAELQRRAAPLEVVLGDALVRTGRADEAALAYERALGRPGTDGVRERLIHALRTNGNDAGAALVLLNELDAGAQITPDTAALLGTLAEAVRPRTLIADALATIDDQGSATRRADLAAARAIALPRTPGLSLIERTLTTDRVLPAPGRQHLIATGLRLIRGDDDAAPAKASDAWLRGLIDADPSLARDVAWTLTRAALPADPFPRFAERRDAGSLLLTGEIALLQGDLERIASVRTKLVDRELGDNGASVWLKSLRARTSARLGLFADSESDAAELLAAALADPVTPVTPALLPHLALQRANGALRALNAAERTDDLLERAALRAQTGDLDGARADLESARALDPRDERIYAALIAFYAPTGPAPDESAMSEVGRALRTNLPESGLLRAMLAGEMLRRNLIDDAAAIAVPLYTADPTDPARLDAMLNLWRRRAQAGLADRNELETIRALSAQHPNDPGLVRLLAGGLVLTGAHADAESVLVAFAESSGDRTLSSLREQIVRDGLKEPERAESLARARLGPAPRSIDATIELLSITGQALAANAERRDRLAEMRSLIGSVPQASTLTQAQRAAALQAVARAAVIVETARRAGDGNTADRDDLLAMLDWSASRNLPIAPGLHQLRLALLAETDAPARTIINAADLAIRAQAPGSDLRRGFLRSAADLLVSRGDFDEAFDLVAGRALPGDGTPDNTLSALDPDTFTEWFRLVVVFAQTDTARAIIRASDMLDRLETADAVREAWETVRPEGAAWTDPGEEGSSADLAYLLALYAPDLDGSGATRKGFLRLALERDPGHAWAANDLGYTMLEAGEDLAEAERLIEIAYDARPDRANIVDSLGWVRYHRGKLEDTADPETGEAIPGAVSLLQRAAALSEADDDGVVHDHLGDALYASGREAEAIAAWKQAARLANAALSRMRASGRAEGVRSSEVADLAVRAIMKPNAIQIGQPPAIEPQRGVAEQGGSSGSE